MLLNPAKASVDIGIVAKDIQKSLDFYQGLLGLEKTQEVPTPYGTFHRLRFGTSLLKILDPQQLPAAGPIGLEKQLGLRFLSFTITNLDGVCAVLEKEGVEFTLPATQVMADTRVAMVKDPDGNIIEFVEQS